MPYVSDEARREMLSSLDAVVANLDDRPLLPMPSLERFDKQFRPMDGGATAGA